MKKSRWGSLSPDHLLKISSKVLATWQVNDIPSEILTTRQHTKMPGSILNNRDDSRFSSFSRTSLSLAKASFNPCCSDIYRKTVHLNIGLLYLT